MKVARGAWNFFARIFNGAISKKKYLLGLPRAFYLFLGACVFHKYLSSAEEIVLQAKENENARQRNENAASAGKKMSRAISSATEDSSEISNASGKTFLLFRLSCRSYFRCIIKKLCITWS
jgi:hypothetical protein